jgi:hypothetical protein
MGCYSYQNKDKHHINCSLDDVTLFYGESQPFMLSSGTRIFNIRGPLLYCKFMGISTPISALILCSSINQSYTQFLPFWFRCPDWPISKYSVAVTLLIRCNLGGLDFVVFDEYHRGSLGSCLKHNDYVSECCDCFCDKGSVVVYGASWKSTLYEAQVSLILRGGESSTVEIIYEMLQLSNDIGSFFN